MREFITGLFIISGILIGVGVYFFMVNYTAHHSGFDFYLKTDNAGGINNRAEIRYKGVEVGYVKSVEIYKDSVLIKGYISDKVHLEKPVFGTIEDLSLIGGSRVLNLHATYGSGKCLEEGDTIIAYRTSLWEDVASLSEIIKEMINEGKLNYVTDILKSLKHGVNSLNKSMNISSDIKNTLSRIDTLTVRMDNILLEIESGRGTLGKTIKEDSLYEEAKKTVRDLDSLVNDVKLNPHKYIKVNIFGK